MKGFSSATGPLTEMSQRKKDVKLLQLYFRMVEFKIFSFSDKAERKFTFNH